MTILIKEGLVYQNGRFERQDVYVNELGKMLLAKTIDIDADEIIDASGLHVVPGFIDVHVHLREPGFEYKETIASGTLAAIKGGYTTLMCMPNVKPCTDNVAAKGQLLNIIKRDSYLNVIPYASITINQEGKQLSDFSALSKYTIAFSDDGRGVQDASMMEEAMIKAKSLDCLIVAHCEDRKELKKGGSIHDGIKAKEFGLVGINSASEYNQIARDIELAKKIGCQYHVCHISTKEGVELIRQAKKDGVNVSCEVTPHHLLLNETDIKTDDGNYKMNPPLRTAEDQQALIEGLVDGTIEIIATDHAPHSQIEKDQGLAHSAMGIIGSELAFGLLYGALVKTNRISLEKLIDCMSYNPANIFGLDGGELKNFENASIAILNLKDQEKITVNSIASRSKNTPFIGKYLQGINYMTIVNGKTKYRRKDF